LYLGGGAPWEVWKTNGNATNPRFAKQAGGDL
jgi:hypothetical protein